MSTSCPQPQPSIYLLWAFGDEETRLVIEAAHERAIVRVLEWIEDEVAAIRYGKDGVYRVRPPGGLVAARFRHYEARSGRPLLHDHVLLSVKGQPPEPTSEVLRETRPRHHPPERHA
ncbi:relaxase domain-containing protein [Streptomyces rubiginosohelvolus]|uniref:relaxase domain-containing protein n=1 Tax=Streptomyces rubiginosohelvolus TaxID=67362 RepID=UPI00382EB90C